MIPWASGPSMTVREALSSARERLLRRFHVCPPPPVPPVVAEMVVTGPTWKFVLPVRRFTAHDGVLHAVGELRNHAGSVGGRYTYALRSLDGVEMCIGSNEMSPTINLRVDDSLDLYLPLSVTPDLRINE